MKRKYFQHVVTDIIFFYSFQFLYVRCLFFIYFAFFIPRIISLMIDRLSSSVKKKTEKNFYFSETAQTIYTVIAAKETKEKRNEKQNMYKKKKKTRRKYYRMTKQSEGPLRSVFNVINHFFPLARQLNHLNGGFSIIPQPLR